MRNHSGWLMVAAGALALFLHGCGPGGGGTDSGMCVAPLCGVTDSGVGGDDGGSDAAVGCVIGGSCVATDRLVDTAWLEGALTDPNVQIIDMRAMAAYDAEHIDGAVWVDANAIRATVMGIAGQVAPEADVALVLSNAGIRNDATIVTYGDDNGLAAARMLWTLEYYDHSDVRLLDGGWMAWSAEGRPTSTTPTPVAPTTFDIAMVHDELRVDGDWLLANLGDPTITIVDVRSTAEYAAGHIPGAVHHEWSAALSGAFLMMPTALATMYADVPSNTTVIVYCQTGVRASMGYFTLTWLGYSDVRLYDGSWSEWGSRPDTPIEM